MELDYDALLTLTTEIGYRLQINGAEIYRVEESMQRILQAYGVQGGEVFAIPSCIIVGLTTPDGQPLTRIRRIRVQGTDLERLEAYNDLCRVVCEHRPDLDMAWALLDRISSGCRSVSPAGQLVGYFLATGAFSFFYGGSWQDGLCGGLCGVAIGLCLSFMTRMGANLFFKTIAGAAVSGVLALLLTWMGLGEHTEYIIIGALMALVPGTLFTYAMRDIMAGDMVAGISKGAEALLIGAAIALGTGFALALARSIGG